MKAGMARDIGTWLEGLGQERFADAYAEKATGINALPNVAEDDLKHIGARRTLLFLCDDPVPQDLKGISQ